MHENRKKISYQTIRSALYIAIILVSTNPPVKAQAEASAIKKVFQAGASLSNITPPLGEGIVGNFGDPPPAQYIHDQLHVRSLVLDNGEERLAFAIVDNVGVKQEVLDEAKAIIRSRGFDKGHILISSTHTHSATSASGVGTKRMGFTVKQPLDDYQNFVARRIADGVQVAINNMRPAKIGWGVGSVPQHLFNRRWKMKPGTPLPNPFGGTDKVLMNPGTGNPNLLEPAGPTDPGLSFISVQTLTGEPIALLANYSLHYVGGVPKNDISADYYGVFCSRMEELLKAERRDTVFVGMMSNGTSGDVNNINVSGPKENYPPYEKMQLVANDVAKEVMRVYKTVKHQEWVKLAGAETELQLQVRRPTPAMLDYAQEILKKPASAPVAHRNEKDYANRIIQIQKEWPEQIKIVLQAFRIGELGVASIPFEVFTQTGLEIKARSPFKPTFTIELANGSYGYLPTPEQHLLGGYETWLGTNRVEIEASRKITSTLLQLFEQLK